MRDVTACSSTLLSKFGSLTMNLTPHLSKFSRIAAVQLSPSGFPSVIGTQATVFPLTAFSKSLRNLVRTSVSANAAVPANPTVKATSINPRRLTNRFHCIGAFPSDGANRP
jgi:hypothetical protein